GRCSRAARFQAAGHARHGFRRSSRETGSPGGSLRVRRRGRLKALTMTQGGHALAERPEGMTFESGGQGLWSTFDDYLAFARIFLGHGEGDGVAVLRLGTSAAVV